MRDWRAVATRLKEGLNAARTRLKGWLDVAWPRLKAWWAAGWSWMRTWLSPLWARLMAWAREHRERLVPAAGFLGGSLALFLALALTAPSPAVRVAERYLDAAFTYDYMGLYALFDDRVLEGELARYGLDRAGMAALARTNRGQLEEYVADIEGRYGVEISFSHQVSLQRPLERDEREALEGRYAADGMDLDIRDARRVSAWVAVQLTGGDQTQTLPRELELTAIATPGGWSLDRDSMYAFLDIIYDLPTSVPNALGT